MRSLTRRRSTREAGRKPDQAALDDLDDLALDGLAGVELLLDGVPGALVLGTLLGEDQTTLLVLLLENESLDLVAHGNDIGGVDVLANGELAGGDDALGLVADVKQDLVALDLHDGAGDEAALVKVGNGAVDEVVHLLVGDVVQREDGRVLNLTQKWTPFEQRGPGRHGRCLQCLESWRLRGNLHALGGRQIRLCGPCAHTEDRVTFFACVFQATALGIYYFPVSTPDAREGSARDSRRALRS